MVFRGFYYCFVFPFLIPYGIITFNFEGDIWEHWYEWFQKAKKIILLELLRSVFSLKFEIWFPEIWLMGTDRGPTSEIKFVTKHSQEVLPFIHCGQRMTLWWKLRSYFSHVIQKVKYPGENSECILRVVCFGQLCESEVKKEVTGFQLEWWSNTQVCIYTLNFDLLYLYYYYYQFSGG